METKEIMDTQTEETVKNTKSTRDRLDEVRELYKDGYLTENEFMVARINILKEGGIDVVTRLQHAYRRPLQEEEEDSKGGGCGCFLIALLLTAFIVLSMAFFAAPYWPERLGGAEARMAREWFTAKGNELVGRFFRESSTEPARIPDPVPTYDERSEEDFSGVTEPDSTHIISETEPPDAADEPVTMEPPAPVAPGTGPDTIMEIQMPVPVELNVGFNAENAVRGYITVPNARIRSAPDTSTNDNVIGWGSSGDRFTILEEGSGGDGSKWYNIIYEDGSNHGWISGSLVRLEE